MHMQAGETDSCGPLGKSSLTVQFVDGHFVESYYPTIENTFSKVIRYKNQEFATEIIDTAGQVRRFSTPLAPSPSPTCASHHPTPALTGHPQQTSALCAQCVETEIEKGVR